MDSGKEESKSESENTGSHHGDSVHTFFLEKIPTLQGGFRSGKGKKAGHKLPQDRLSGVVPTSPVVTMTFSPPGPRIQLCVLLR